ncbi:MAG: 30S ribosomal protein S17 [Methanosarcinaceae archaeon]|nr:30S ribosomal protein S17 [Methanosarcinaceae archaeon]
MSKDIGLNVPLPEHECNDINCPFHGKLSVRGQTLIGTVISSKMDKTVVIERQHQATVTKYNRYEKRRTVMHAHNPPCLNAKQGDVVTITECRPLSKTKSFVVVKVEGASE